MALRRVLKFSLIGLFVLLAIAALAVLAALSNAKVEMADSGVHTRLLVPLPRGAIGVQMYAGTGESVSITDYLAGPVVRRSGDGRWTAAWFCRDRVQRTGGDGTALTVECAGRRHVFALDDVPALPEVAPMPERLVVLSDLEGNSRFLEAALRKLGVVDEGGRWSYGAGQLLVLGDSVDRGRDVFEVLWRLHGLSAEAAAAGGAVRVMLGNHEQYLLRGNVSRAHPEYRYALAQLGGPVDAFAADSVLGSWLRRQPVVLKLGTVLFAHGGISPQVVDAGLSLGGINRAMRDYWQLGGEPAARSPAFDAVLGYTGVTQYRGYFHGLKGRYAAATDADVDHVLAHFDATRVVVAHTLVEKVEQLFDGRVVAVDVNDDEARPEVLLYENGVPRVVDIDIARDIDTRPASRTREFSLFDRADRALLGRMLGEFRRLGAIPAPY